MRKQIRNTLPIMRPPTRLGKGRTNIHRLQPITKRLLLLMRHRIRHHDSTKLTPVQRLDGIATQDAVRDDSHDFFGAVLHHGVGGFDERAASVGHVVDEDGDAVLDVADEHHAADFVGAGAFFVDEGEAEVEAVGYGCCSILYPLTSATAPHRYI